MVDAAHSIGWKWISDDLEYINHDNSYPRKNIKCPKCKQQNLNAYYQNNKFNLINVCKNCNYYWNNN